MITRELEGLVGQGRSQGSYEHIGLRVRLGVTGHRQLDDEERIAEALVERLRYIGDWFIPTQDTSVVFSLLTALAEGADRLVPRQARAVLGGEKTEIEAVLPLPVVDYLDDFETGESREDFRRLLGDASSRVVLADAPKPQGPERDAAYAKAGRYIVEHCDVLIAVWDGKASRGIGGTADIVQYAREQEVPVLIVPAAGEHGDSHAQSLDAAAPRLKAWLESFSGTDEYNRASVPEGRLREAEKTARAPLEALEENGHIRSQIEQVAGWGIPHLARADALALRYQARYTWLARISHLLSLLAVIAVGAQIVFAPNKPVWLFGEIAFLIALVVAVWAAKRGRTHERWIGYRSLAEAFRAALFIALSGAGDLVEDSAGQADISERPWSQRAFSEAWRRRPRIVYDEAAVSELHACLTTGWIATQVDYHRRAVGRYARGRNLYARGISALAAVTIVVATLHIFVVSKTSGAATWLEFVAIVLPGIGAAITGLRDHAQHRVHEDRSRRTITRLERLLRQFPAAQTLDSVRRLALETHRVIVEENQDWWGVIEFQDIELVL